MKNKKPASTKQPEKQIITLSLDRSIISKVDELAKLDGRTRAGQIRFFLGQMLPRLATADACTLDCANCTRKICTGAKAIK